MLSHHTARSTARDSAEERAMIFDPGQIFDFEYTPKKTGQLAIEFGEPAFGAPPDKAPKQTRVEVVVR